MNSRRLRALVTAVASAAVALSITTPAMAAPAADPVLELESMAFDRARVDVTQEQAYVNLTWTVTDRAARAQRVYGAVELRQFAGGEQVGQPLSVDYDLECCSGQVRGSGTARRSTYVYTFVVPRHATVAETSWRVTKITLADDVAHARTIRDPGPASLAVAQAVDDSGPVAEQLYLHYDQPLGVYDDGSGVTLRYRLHATDETGVKRGKLTIAGPGGRRLSATFQVVRGESGLTCNDEYVWDTTWVTCPIPIAVPAGTPSGSWSVVRLDLTDNWGNTRADTSPEGPEPIVVSRNDVVGASEFALTEPRVNNWRKPATTAVRFKPHGAVGGLASAELRLAWCSQQTRPTEVDDEGFLSIGIVVPAGRIGCEIRGLKLTDGAGNVAFYGTAYDAPDLGLTITTVPDEKAPVVLSARLPKATWTQQETEDAWGLGFEVTTEVDDFASVNGFSATIYDSEGSPQGGMHGGEHDDGTGILRLAVSTGRLAPGQYTIGFSLTDEAENTSAWGYPRNSNPIPGGPLVLTVVAD